MEKSKGLCLVDLHVSEGANGLRLDKFLSSLHEITSRSQAGKLIANGQVFINNLTKKSSYLIQEGDHLQVYCEEKNIADEQQKSFDLEIIEEDDDLLIINKPAGIVVHPSHGHRSNSVVDLLKKQNISLSSGFHPERPGIVHRLDKDTSGLLVIAKNDFAQDSLAKQFKAKSVKRTYWAICFGQLSQDEGTIKSFLARHPVHRKRRSSIRNPLTKKVITESCDLTTSGKVAITHFKVIQKHPSGLSLLNVELETGRTHQIRVHLSEAGHPIVGDPMYSKGHHLKQLKGNFLPRLISNLNRCGLHAAKLGFIHPRTGREIMHQAPWPEDLLELIKACEFDA